MNSDSIIKALRAELAQLEKEGATVEQLQLFSRRVKAHADLEALAESTRSSSLARWVNPTSVLVYTGLIAALATLITSKIQEASYNNYFRSMVGQASITSNETRPGIANKLLLLRDAEIVPLSDAAAAKLKTEAAQATKN